MYHFPSSLLVEIIFPQKITYMGLVYKWMGGISNSCVLAKAAPQGRQTVGAKGGPGPQTFGKKKTKVFSTNAQSRFASVILDGALDLHAKHATLEHYRCFSTVPDTMLKVCQGPLKGAVSTQKALQGSETEMKELMGGRSEKSISLSRGHQFALQAPKFHCLK